MTEVKGHKTNTATKPCTCKNEYQDRVYGAGNRVMNSTASSYRCTVCKRVI